MRPLVETPAKGYPTPPPPLGQWWLRTRTQRDFQKVRTAYAYAYGAAYGSLWSTGDGHGRTPNPTVELRCTRGSLRAFQSEVVPFAVCLRVYLQVLRVIRHVRGKQLSVKDKSKGQGPATRWVAYCVLRDLEYQPYAKSAYAYAAQFSESAYGVRVRVPYGRTLPPLPYWGGLNRRPPPPLLIGV